MNEVGVKEREKDRESHVHKVEKPRKTKDKASKQCKPDKASKRQTQIRTREKGVSVLVNGYG